MGYNYSTVFDFPPTLWLSGKREEAEKHVGKYIEGLFLRFWTRAAKEDRPARQNYVFRVTATNVQECSYLAESKWQSGQVKVPDEYVVMGSARLDRKLAMVREDSKAWAGVPFKITYLGTTTVKTKNGAVLAHDFSVECDRSYVGHGDQGAEDATSSPEGFEEE